MTNLLPEEILCSVLALLENDKIRFTSHKLHKTFYIMGKDPEFSAILEKFDFSGSPISPYSEVLAAALFNLQFSKKLIRANSELNKYDITEAFAEYYNNHVKAIIEESPELKPALRSIATALIT